MPEFTYDDPKDEIYADLDDLVKRSQDATRELADEAERIIETLSNELEHREKQIETMQMTTSPMLHTHVAMWFLMFCYGLLFGVSLNNRM